MKKNYTPQSYSEILPASLTGFYNITHNFDSYDILYSLYDDLHKCVAYTHSEIKLKDSNTITIYFATKIDAERYRIVIKS